MWILKFIWNYPVVQTCPNCNHIGPIWVPKKEKADGYIGKCEMCGQPVKIEKK